MSMMDHDLLQRALVACALPIALIALDSCRDEPVGTDQSKPDAQRQWTWSAALPNDSAVFLPGLVSLPDRIEQSITFSPTGDTLVFSAIIGRRDGRNLWAMFMSQRTNGTWSTPDTLPFSGRYSDYGAAFAPEGRALYFSSRRPIADTTSAIPDDYDLWKSERVGNTWSAPARLANGINTDGNEYSVAPTATQLIICAQRHDALATSDLFIALRAEEFNDFGPVHNLGTPVNTTMWEGQAFALDDQLWWNHVDESPGSSEDILYSQRTANGWSDPIRTSARVNSPANEFMHCVSPDGRFIFFGRHGDILSARL